nr:hypothetical protein [Tanacetum cinerariifolium]
MEQYLTNTDYGLWQVIMNGDEPVQTTRDDNGVETEKFLRALPSSWNNIALIMRNKEGIDELDINDLYNDLIVFEFDIKGSHGSSSNSHNVAFLSAKDINNINEVNAANGVSTTAGHSSSGQASSSSYTDDLMFSFFATQSNSPQLDDKDLEQIDHDDLEEMDLKWQMTMLSMRVKQYYKKTGRKLNFNSKEPISFDKTKVECFNCHRRGHFTRECRAPRNQGNRNGYTRKATLIEEPKALKRQVQIDLDEEVARQLEAKLNVDINWNAVIEQVKRSERLTDVKEVRKDKEVEVESSKREGESLEQEIVKKQKMKQEAEELKKRLQTVPDDDDDDVYAYATPLASKIPIVDYKIHTERNIPYFKIIKADGNHRLFMSFSTMMKDFDREDLESLWKIIRERFEKTEPKNYLDDYLLNTLKIMFEKPN